MSSGPSHFSLIPLTEFIENGPDYGPIKLIHRGADSFLTLHRKAYDENFNRPWENVGSVSVDDLELKFSRHCNFLTEDSYFSINSFYKSGGEKNLNFPELEAVLRKNKALRYLNACFVDIDCHHKGIDDDQAIDEVMRLQCEKTIPAASIIVQSGRGIWLLWLLVDVENEYAKNNISQRAFEDKREHWANIQQELCGRFIDIGADSKSLDPVRVTRIPGSINSKTNRYVEYYKQVDSSGRSFLYNLYQMEDMLGFKNSRSTSTDSGLKPSPKKRMQRKATVPPQTYKQKRVDDLRTLEKLRGGFQDGCRNNALLTYIFCLKNNGANEEFLQNEAKRMADNCHPPLKEAEIGGDLKSARQWSKLKDSTIAGWLEISIKEASNLKQLKSADYYREKEKTPSVNPQIAIKQRHNRIRKIVHEKSILPAVREMESMLKPYGIHASHMTIQRDYKALNIDSGRTKKEIRQKKVRQAKGCGVTKAKKQDNSMNYHRNSRSCNIDAYIE